MQELNIKYLESLRDLTGDITGDITGLCEWLAALPWNGDRKRQFSAEEIRATCFPQVPAPAAKAAREAHRRRTLRASLSREPYVPHKATGLHKGDATNIRQVLKAHATYYGLTLRSYSEGATLHYMLCDKDDAPAPSPRGCRPAWCD